MTVCYKVRQILLQNATAILLQNVTAILLQNATGVYYKMQFFLQNTIVITHSDDFITKCDSYYKIRRLSQIATVQTPKRHQHC